MASLCSVKLPFDVIYTICSEVYKLASRRDLAALCVTSKQVNTAATPWLYHSIELDYSKSKTPVRILFNGRSRYQDLVRDISILDMNSEIHQSQLQRLIETIPLLRKLRRFRWSAVQPIPSSLICAVQSCSNVKDIIIESQSLWSTKDVGVKIDAEIKTQSANTTTDFFPFKFVNMRRAINTEADFHTLSFMDYRFPPGLDHFDTPRLNMLHLNNCANVGYLFNSLLCNLSQIRITGLSLSQDKIKPSTGYLGKEKIECFLMVYRGLETLALSNLGENRPCLGAILAQGPTLKFLDLCEMSTKEDYTADQPLTVAGDSDMDRIRRACPHLHHLSVRPATEA